MVDLADVVSGAKRIWNLPSEIGAGIAQRGMSDYSKDLAERYGATVEANRGQDARSCAVNAATSKITGKDAACNYSIREEFRSAAGEVVSRGAARAFGSTGAGIVTDMAGRMIEVDRNHRGAIELMAKNGVPGFAYKETQVSGVTQRVWVDATSTGLEHHGEPKVYAELVAPGMSHPEIMQQVGNNTDQSQLKAAVNATTAEATESAQAYAATHSPDQYREHLEAQNDKIPEYYTAQITPVAPVVAREGPETGTGQKVAERQQTQSAGMGT